MKKKVLALSVCLMLAAAPAWAEDPAAGAAAAGDASSGFNITSLPERKNIQSLTDVMSDGEAVLLQQAISDALVDYAENGAAGDEKWTENFLAKQSSITADRIPGIAAEIQAALDETDAQRASLAEAVEAGETKEGWLEGSMKKYITKAVEVTGGAPKISSEGRSSGFTLAGRNWKGRALSDAESKAYQGLLLADKDRGVKTAVAAGLVAAAEKGNISMMNQSQPKQLTFIAINAVDEAKTVLKVKKGMISGKEGVSMLTDAAMTSVVGMLSGLDYKQIGFIAGTAAGTAAGGALEGATGGLSLGTITVNGALIGAYLGEKIGTKIGQSINESMDDKLHARIVNEFESFLGGTVASVINVGDVSDALSSMESESDVKLTEKAAELFDKAKEGAKSAGSTTAEAGKNAWETVKDWGSRAGHAIGSTAGDAGSWIVEKWHRVRDAVREKIGN